MLYTPGDGETHVPRVAWYVAENVQHTRSCKHVERGERLGISPPFSSHWGKPDIFHVMYNSDFIVYVAELT